LTIGAGAGVASAVIASKNAVAPSQLDDLIKDVYKFNDTLEIPSVAIDGATDVSTTLIYPNGVAKKSSKVKLDQAGKYKLRYTYTKDGETKFVDKYFDVKYGLYYFASDGESQSRAEYTSFSEYGEGTDFTYPGSNGSKNPLTIKLSNTSIYPNTGLLVDLAKGEKIVFSEPINVNNLTGEEFLSLFAVPYSQLTNDFSTFYINLTDAEDPNTYISFKMHKIVFSVGNYEAISALNVAGQNQIYAGTEIKSSGNKIHKNDAWGCLVDHSFQASSNYNNGWPDYQGTICGIPSNILQLSLGCDVKTMNCFTNLTSSWYRVAFPENKMTSFADLDSPALYDDAWTGFKSDKAYLSISLDGYTGTSGRFMISNYAFNDLSAEYIEDVEAPKLVVNTPYTPSNMPKAYVGKEYPVPTADAYDALCGKTDVKVTVDYNHISGNPTNVKINNGKFLPDKAGAYRINYVAKDPFGNETKVSYFVETSDEIEPISVVVNDRHSKIDLGDTFTYDTPVLSGGSGSLEYRVVLENDGNEYDITENRSMVINNSKDWLVKYIVNDYAGGEKIFSYFLNVTATNKAFMYEEPIFDPYLFNNVPTLLPNIKAYVYSSGVQEEVTPNVEISYKGNTKTYSAGENFLPQVENTQDEIGITYFVGETRFNTIYKSVIDIGDANYLKIQNYFLGAESNAELDDKGVQFVNTGSNSEISWTFANKFLVNNTGINLGNIYAKNTGSRSNLAEFDFTYVDSINSNLKVTVKASVGVDSIAFEINGNTYNVATKLNAAKSTNFTVSYSDGSIVFEEGKTKLVMPINTYDNGDFFTKFPSSSVSISLTAKGIKENNGYYLYKIGGCPVSEYTTDDSIAPYVYTTSSPFGSYKKGYVYTVNKCLGSDVLAPRVNTKLSVVGPDGNYVTSVAGVELNKVECDVPHQFVLEKIGMYQIVFEVVEKDWHWSNPSSSMINADCVDTVAPTIEILEEVPTEVRVGDIVYIPAFRVSDDETPVEKLTVSATVIFPNMRDYEVDINGGFKATLPGTYTLMISARDESNRFTVVQFVINCVE
ncbi:MAG: hypothetical protein MJ248_03790, partial [Bacilli bacterium]|nr:hypothetical protein [Bacilli bacterium]